MTESMDPTVVALFLPFCGALVAPLFVRAFGHRAAWFLALLPLLAFLHFAALLPEMAGREIVKGGFDWAPSLGLRFSWLLDGLSVTFALLITGIGALIILYTGGYLKGHPHLGRFFSFIFLFMGSMLGVVVSDDFLMLFVFWELTSITSFLLIGFDHKREASRRAALQALVVTGGGGLALLAGLLLIGIVTETAQMSDLAAKAHLLRSTGFYLPALILILGGAFTKSAQFPFHFWLPNAMEAPTPVSAYLHSATMVKAGVYLLMRLNPVMGGTAAWQTLLTAFGAATLIVGAVLAIRQTDLKLQLAYTTVGSLGLLVMLTGFGSPVAIEAAVLYLVAHALFKGALFMVAGIIDHETGTRDVTRLGGLRALMPATFAAALAAAASMGGLPPFFGFLAKEEVYAALTGGDVPALLLTAVAVFGNALMFAIGFVVAWKPFAGKPVATPRQPHEAPPLLLAGPAVLAALGLAAALFSGLTHHYISSPMATVVSGGTVHVAISPVPHLGLPLLLSLLTILAGIVVYRGVDGARNLVAGLLAFLGPGPDRGFDAAIRGLIRFARGATRLLQPGRLEIYITATFLCLIAVLLLPPVIFGELPVFPANLPRLQWHEVAILVIALAGLIAVLIAKDRLTAIVSLGIQGFAVAMIFLLFGAPDLAFTQFMVETLSVVILAFVMTRLRLSPADRRPRGQRRFDATVAIACGIGFSALLMKVTAAPFDDRLTVFFNHYSKLVAHGANVVNVILVDFRGTDTIGEIAVVAVAGLAILALIRLRAGKGDAAP